jgi:predicted ArsR family transcriptional regulator
VGRSIHAAITISQLFHWLIRHEVRRAKEEATQEMIPRLSKHFWTTTQGRIVLLLRRGSHTVNELAASVELTANAVRAQLTALERDGLVRQSGKRPGLRKPTVTYDLTPEAAQFFPKAHGVVLHHLLDALKERIGPKKLDGIVRTVGHRMAPSYRPRVEAGHSLDRSDHAIAVLRELGGFCESQTQNGKVGIQCFDCPLSPITMGHREICVLVETVLADILGVSVQQHCRTDPTPQCRFEIDMDSG